jgi:hypothetical protein
MTGTSRRRHRPEPDEGRDLLLTSTQIGRALASQFVWQSHAPGAAISAPQRPGDDNPRSSCGGVAVDNDQAGVLVPSNVIRFTVRCDGLKYWFDEYPTYLSVSVGARPPAADGSGFIVSLVRGQGGSAGIGRLVSSSIVSTRVRY